MNYFIASRFFEKIHRLFDEWSLIFKAARNTIQSKSNVCLELN